MMHRKRVTRRWQALPCLFGVPPGMRWDRPHPRALPNTFTWQGKETRGRARKLSGKKFPCPRPAAPHAGLKKARTSAVHPRPSGPCGWPAPARTEHTFCGSLRSTLRLWLPPWIHVAGFSTSRPRLRAHEDWACHLWPHSRSFREGMACSPLGTGRHLAGLTLLASRRVRG